MQAVKFILSEVSMTIYGLNMDGLGTDTRQARIKRAVFGAFYGFLGGAAFVFMAAFIDVLLNPDLPYGVDWSAFMLRIPFIALGLALVGAVTCWWHEAWQGLIGGAVVASALALITALFSSQVGAGLKMIVLVFILVPMAVTTLPIVWTLRWVTERHARALQLNRSSARIAWLVLIVLALGAGCGYFMKTSAHGVEVAHFMQGLLQNPTQAKNPLGKIEGVLDRQDLTYKLYQKKSIDSTEGYNIRVEYADGFVLRCTIVAYPGTNPFISGCETDQ
jgi:hypothetical protein